jgi:hypothetical protein
MCIICIFYSPLPLSTFFRRKKKQTQRRSAGQNKVTVQRVFSAEIKIARLFLRMAGKDRKGKKTWECEEEEMSRKDNVDRKT